MVVCTALPEAQRTPEAVAGAMQSRLGDVLDAADFPRFRGAEGQRALDLEPDVTREMMRRMAPGLGSSTSRMPDQQCDLLGVNQVDLSNRSVALHFLIGTELLLLASGRHAA